MRALVLDFGGTVDTDGVHWSEKFYGAYERAGVPVGREDFLSAYRAAEPLMGSGRVKANDSFRHTLRLQVSLQFESLKERGVLPAFEARGPRAHQIADACYRDVRETIGDIRPLLRAWSRRCPLGLVSNFYGNLATVCRELKIASLFDVMVDSAVAGVRKPDPGIFSLACEALHARPEDVVVVGDSYERDIVPAKTIGCLTVWLRGGSGDVSPPGSGADFIIQRMRELQPHLFERIPQ